MWAGIPTAALAGEALVLVESGRSESPNPLLFSPVLILSFSTSVRGLAFEEFGFGPGVKADCFVVSRESLKGFLAIGILCNENPF